MKTISIILTLALVMTVTARIGETPKECQKRYGKPVVMNKKDQILAFKKAGFTLALKYWKGKAHQLYIASSTENELGISEKISDTQLRALLLANLGKEYKKLKKEEVFDDYYASSDETIIAVHDTMKNTLLISTVELKDKILADEAKKEKKALEDF